ncbi:MAG: hypothetical protein PUA57_07815 [Eggerthellales bacterium]|nr:hypothetical protein [Eggerthellales bacterium]
MEQQGRYSRIQVGSSNQDQVIYAGAWPCEGGSAPSSAGAEGSAVQVQVEVGEGAGAPASAQVGEGAGVSASARSQKASPAAARSQEAPKPASPRGRKTADPTLEDLEAEPMSGLQKGVLAAAALFVAAFALYWFVIRPMGL